MSYIDETRAELKHVTWPSRRQAIVFSIIVIIVSVATALYLGLFDYLFQLGFSKLIG